MRERMRLRLMELVQASRFKVTLHERWTLQPSDDRSEHVAPRPKVIGILSGGLEYKLAGTTLMLQPGDVIYRPAWTAAAWCSHQSEPTKLWYTEWQFASPEVTMVDPMLARDAVEQIDHGSTQTLRLMRKWDEDEMLPVDEVTHLQLEAELRAMLTRFLSYAKVIGTQHDATAGVAADLRQWVGLLEHHFADPEALDRLFAQARVSESQVRRQFKTHTGKTPGQYLTMLRMQAAQYFLRVGRHNVKEAAHAVGYRDAKYFARQYARHWGHPPIADRH